MGMKQRFFWEQIFSRIIAVGILAYLIYSLVFIGQVLTGLHVWMALIALVLVLVPMASRLKIFNFLDFTSKIDNIQKEQQETKNALVELRSQISAAIDVRVSPVQHQTNILSLSSININELMKLAQSSTPGATETTIKEPQYTINRFLRRANLHRSRAFSILFIARHFQEALLNHELGKDIAPEETLDEKIHSMSKSLLDKGLDKLFPIHIVDENGKTELFSISEISEGLQLVDSFLDMYQKIDKQEMQVPDNADELLNKIEHTMYLIQSGIVILGTSTIVSEYNLRQTFAQLQSWIQEQLREIENSNQNKK